MADDSQYERVHRHGFVAQEAKPIRQIDFCKKKALPSEAPLASQRRDISGVDPRKSLRIIHLELDRMRRHLEALDLGHLQFDVAVDEVVVENAAVLEERAILVEIVQRLAERATHRRDRLQLFLRQIVE